MWKNYKAIIYPRISLSEERGLISKAQKGSQKSRDEIILRHIRFLIFRIRKLVFPHLLHSYGEDLLQETILIIYAKIEQYNLNYCNDEGELHPVRFSSYIWKRIDGYIIDFLKKELKTVNYYSE
jgi:DNA-directed RNA polymerase specialized sigma subunit